VCCLVDLTSWRTKIADDSSGAAAVEECEIGMVDTVSDTRQQQQQPYHGSILTIGCCGL